jgi:hypothetical protein
MNNDTFFASCGELLGRWTAAFVDGLRRGRERAVAAPADYTPRPRPVCATSDPEMHPYP